MESDQHLPANIERGTKLLHNPLLNKGTAFTREERKKHGLQGLLPPKILSQDMQLERVKGNLQMKPNDLEKYIYLIALQDRNENLFYRVIMDDLDSLVPIIYTPTVGKACQSYGHIYRRPRGLYITNEDKGNIGNILKNWPHKDAKVIVVTDGERILGLGDLGTDGMGIPIGKLSLYTACAGIHPSHCLPVMLDMGTNNRDLLEDHLYLGLQHLRIRGEDYDELVKEFIEAASEIFPNILIQLEDFATKNAFQLLNRYRNQYCLFDDDIQGTASVTLAGLLSAMRITQSEIEDQKFLILGAGEAGIGIGEIITSYLKNGGMEEDQARQKCWYVDSRGLVCSARNDLATHKVKFAHDHPNVSTFAEAVDILKPTAIIGVSGQPGQFSKDIVEKMSRLNERPVIFALSNPTSKSECTAAEAYNWSDGRAVFASGSPFDPVEFKGRTIIPGQGNNVYIFPGIGLGVTFSKARLVTERMFLEASKVLAGMVSEKELMQGSIYPVLGRIREVSEAIACAVVRVAIEDGLTHLKDQYEPGVLKEKIRKSMYTPAYQPME